MGRPEGKTRLGISRRRYEDNIKMDIQKVVWEGMEWIDVSWGRDKWWALVNAVMNIRSP